MSIIIKEEGNLREMISSNTLFDLDNQSIVLNLTKYFLVNDGAGNWAIVQNATKATKKISISNDRLINAATRKYVPNYEELSKEIQQVSDTAPVGNFPIGYKYMNSIDNIVYRSDGSDFIEASAEHPVIKDLATDTIYEKRNGVYVDVSTDTTVGAYHFFMSFKGSDIGMTSLDDPLLPYVANAVDQFILDNYDLNNF